MELRPPASPVEDPLFAEVRRRHPDVDLVILPPEDRTDPTDPVPDVTVARVLELVGETAELLWDAAAPDSDTAPVTTLEYADREADVRAVSRVVDHRSDGSDALDRLAVVLEANGWFVQRPPGALERLVAELDGGHLTASYAEASGAVLVELASAALPVGVERARELVR